MFAEAGTNWDDHLARLAAFWSSVMLTSGRYKGSPVAKHLMQAKHLTLPMFERWLELWARTTDEMLPSATAAAMQAKAARIAESLQLAVTYRPAPGLPPSGEAWCLLKRVPIGVISTPPQNGGFPRFFGPFIPM